VDRDGPTDRRGRPTKQELRDGFRRMRKLSWIGIAFQVVAAVGLASIAGGSQVLKTEWIENALALIPAIGVLLTYKFENRRADGRRPFGYHRAGTIAFLLAALVLAGIGAYLCVENSLKLLHGERPSIGGFPLFGHVVWQGWVMMVAMAVTAIPPLILGRKKTKVAELLHDKPLHADAEMNRANWMTNAAGIVGLLLVAWGFWWGDAAAALVLSLDILRDGGRSVVRSLSDVMDHHPVDVETDKEEPIIADVAAALDDLPWVAERRVLMREHGRYIYAEIFLRPAPDMPPVLEATRIVRDAVLPLDWRLQHLAVEFTDDVKSAANVLTREELDIEDQR
jgi:divalent metal cation (Fe/Co/Zn/Cd) transporter